MIVSNVDPITRCRELEEQLLDRERKLDEQAQKIDEQAQKIDEQAQKIGELEKVIKEWTKGHRVRPKRRRNKNKKKAKDSKSSSTEPKKPGRDAGHEGAFREAKGEPDKRVAHHKADCDDCHSALLLPTGNERTRLVEEIIPAQRMLEEHRLFEYCCSCCGKVQWSEMPPEYGPEAPQGRPTLGPSVLAFSAGLRYDFGLSFGQVARFLSVHADLEVTRSGVYQMLERAAHKSKHARQEILLRAKRLPFIHMDETGWYQNGQRLWAWIIGSEELSYFEIDPSRSHKVIERLLCEADEKGELVNAYGGIVVSDFMGAYQTCEWMNHQWCWVHLLRDADKLFDVEPSPETMAFRDRLTMLYHDALQAQLSQDKGQKHGIRVRMGKLANDRMLSLVYPEIEKLQKRIRTKFQDLLRFLDFPGLPAHNNQGERDIRPLVIFRVTSFCTRSARGSEVHAHWMSLVQTARKQNVPLDDFIRQSMASYHSGQPPPSLFCWPEPMTAVPLLHS